MSEEPKEPKSPSRMERAEIDEEIIRISRELKEPHARLFALYKERAGRPTRSWCMKCGQREVDMPDGQQHLCSTCQSVYAGGGSPQPDVLIDDTRTVSVKPIVVNITAADGEAERVAEELVRVLVNALKGAAAP